MAFAVSLIRLTLLEALRTRLPWLVVTLIFASLGAAKFLDQVAIIEATQIQATLLAALLRIAAVFVVVVFVVTSMVREAGDKVSELLLSQAAPRSAYYFGKLAGYSMVAALIAIAFSLPLALFTPLTRCGRRAGRSGRATTRGFFRPDLRQIARKMRYLPMPRK